MESKNRFENIKFNQKLVEEVLERCKEADPKVVERAQFFIHKIEVTPPTVLQYMDYLRRDFIALIQDPKDPIGEGIYDDWKPTEVAELYYVLFGEKPHEWLIGRHAEGNLT